MTKLQRKEKQILLLVLEVLSIVGVKEEELEEGLQEEEEGEPVDHKDLLLLLEGLMLLLQEDREDLELTLDMVLLVVLEELLEDMQGIQREVELEENFKYLDLSQVKEAMRDQ